MSKTVPFQTIQFSISTQFKCKYGLIVKNISISAIQCTQIIQFSISMPLLLFIPGSYQVLPFRAGVDLGAMAMKRYSAFPQALASLEPHHQIVQCHIQDTHWGWVLPLCKGAVCVFYRLTWLCSIYDGRSVNTVNVVTGIVYRKHCFPLHFF